MYQLGLYYKFHLLVIYKHIMYVIMYLYRIVVIKKKYIPIYPGQTIHSSELRQISSISFINFMAFSDASKRLSAFIRSSTISLDSSNSSAVF